jgi:hypothetical protein
VDDIKVTCINPYCDDDKDHLWINVQKMIYHCWKCGYSGRIVENKGILNILKNRKTTKPVSRNKKFVQDSKELIDPNGFIPIESLKSNHYTIEYIKSRCVSIELCTKLGGMYSQQGPLNGRIVFPIKSGNNIVGWQGRSVYNRIPKYLIFGKKSLGIFAIKDLKSYKNFVIIFEGVFDILKVPDYGICILGKKLSKEQKRLLTAFLNVKTVFVMLDSDANIHSKRDYEQELCDELSEYFNTIPVQLKSGDPGDLTENEILKLCLNKIKK